MAEDRGKRPPVVATIGGTIVRLRELVCGDERLPLTSFEVSTLRAALERVAAHPAAFTWSVAGHRLSNPPSERTVRSTAISLCRFLLVGKVNDAPDIAEWRESIRCRRAGAETFERSTCIGAEAAAVPTEKMTINVDATGNQNPRSVGRRPIVR